ncbi:MAG TPA: 3-deoxy-manno-octulosonate cytidylyltransferase, partial [Phycisphaerales bacterium]|nr:3-deoxy-manno-octulosonate cytidylyltransferase [Phycisphaerales bacterium]
MSTVAVIPARYQSSRFPGKPLADETGKPLIQHVVEQVRKARLIDQIIVATDDQRIFDAVKAFGGDVMMTSSDHPNGTSRIAEVAANLPEDADLIVNVQGDEPDIEPEVIDQLVAGLRADAEAPMATLASPFAPDEDPTSPNIVKLVVSQ